MEGIEFNRKESRSVKTIGEQIAEKVIQVTPKPDEGEGCEWWVGLEVQEADAFWDDSCQTKEIADHVATRARKGLAKMIDDALDFDKYQERAFEMAWYPGRGEGNLVYPALGLCGESGEVAEKIKKVIRDSNGVVSLEAKLAILKELSDCLWYVSATAKELGFTLSEVAITNLNKLEDRRDRGVLHGSGDDR
jgi:NTP pyrophosphatase (non-canonical NTP hydrolase)